MFYLNLDKTYWDTVDCHDCVLINNEVLGSKVTISNTYCGVFGLDITSYGMKKVWPEFEGLISRSILLVFGGFECMQ